MKKIISLLSACAIISSFAVSVSAADPVGPTMSLTASTTGYSAGDVVTVVCNYSGFDITPYNDDEGAGQKVTGFQARIDIPGGIGAPSAGKQFTRAGVTNVSGFATGAPTYNWDVTNNQFSAVIANIDDPMQNSGTAFTISMKLNKDITEDLVFAINADYLNKIVYDNYTDWTMGDTVHNTISGENLVSYTLEAPVSDIPVESVTLDNETLALDVYNNATAKLTATVAPADATDPTVTWTSDNDSVATVAADGTVTAVAAGKATITATAGDKSDTCEVTVTDSTPVTPTYPAVGTKIAEDADSNAVYYAGYAESNGEKPLNANTTFEVKNGEDSKMIKSTLGEILGLEGIGNIVGKLHFGVKVMSGSGIDPTKFEIIVH